MITPIPLTPFTLAQRFIGEVHERVGSKHDPFILWCLESVGFIESADEIPWCSAFANRIAWLLRLQRSKSAMARSWLKVGTPIPLAEATVGFDVVILKRGEGEQPGPEVLNAPGHVVFFGGFEPGSDALLKRRVLGVGGNQNDGVTLAGFSTGQVLGVRRLER